MKDGGQLWLRSGLRQFQIVRCVVERHRGRFGVEVRVVEPKFDAPAFIDFLMLADGDEHLTQNYFPAIGTVLDAVTLDFMPGEELRLSARPSSLARQRLADG